VWAVILWPLTVLGADTTETYDRGAVDVEFYTSWLEQPRAWTLGNEVYLGAGLANRFSGFFDVLLNTSDHLANEPGFRIGVFGTPVDTAHFDLDVIAAMGMDGGKACLCDGVELNYDFKPDLRAWGMYLRVLGNLIWDPSPDNTTTSATSITMGAYWTVRPDWQLLLEYDMAVSGTVCQPAWDIGGLALGLNIVLNRTVELITQVYLDIPQQDESWGLGVMAGVIVTIPAD